MLNSRNIDDLHPTVAEKCRAFLTRCHIEDQEIIITSTYRDAESQDALYARGRTAPGPRVTNAPAGKSFHNWRVAFDIVPVRNGKPVWGTAGDDLKLWQSLGAFGESVGLEWAGRWAHFREYPHFQYTGGLTLADFAAGRTLP